MNAEQFDTILANRVAHSVQTLGSKGKEYATEDWLYNFKRAAEIERTTPERALLGMLAKHLVSVLDILEGRLAPTVEVVNEKFGDTINYLILAEAILRERMEAGNADSDQRIPS